jgi:hypothetical protein
MTLYFEASALCFAWSKFAFHCHKFLAVVGQCIAVSKDLYWLKTDMDFNFLQKV